MLHKRMMRYRWYKTWHNQPYANLVHNVLVGAALAFNLSLAYQIQQALKDVF